jgi:hypothetical protein
VVERIESICGGDCTILGGGAVPEFDNGTAISDAGMSIYNHHIFATNRDRERYGYICPGQAPTQEKRPETFIGGGTDKEYMLHTSPDGIVKSGYEVKQSDRIDLAGEFMNYRQQGQKIIIAIDFEYLPGRPEGYLNTNTITLSAAAGCKNVAFNVPTKQYSTESKEWIMPIDGYITTVRGHEHDG